MAVIYAEKSKGEPYLDLFKRLFDSRKPGQVATVKDCVVRGSVAYLAVRRPNNVVDAMVCIMKRKGEELEIVHTHEAMGPHERFCPARILDQLTPLEDGQENRKALEWRQLCRENIDKETRRPIICKGDKVVFNDPLPLAGGDKADEFEAIDPAKSFFRANGVVAKLTPQWLRDPDVYCVYRDGRLIHEPKDFQDDQAGEMAPR